MDSLAGKTAIVRGAGKGRTIGHAVARALAGHGANLVIVGASKSKVNAARELEGEFGIEVMPLFIAHEDEASIATAVQEIAARFGKIDLLVNCKNIARAELLDDLDAAEFEHVLAHCAVVPFVWMRACKPHLAQARGSIVNFCMGAELQDMPATGALSAASCALEVLSKVAAAEWADDGIAVHVMHAHARTQHFDRLAEESPDIAGEYLGKFGPLETLASVGEACVRLIV